MHRRSMSRLTIATDAGVAAGDQVGLGWTVVLRRQPARITAGVPDGYTDAFEIVCCYCGDSPDLDYRHVSAEFQRIRGPYPVAVGVTAYVRHLALHGARSSGHAPVRPARMSTAGDRATQPTGVTKTGETYRRHGAAAEASSVS